MWSKGTIGITCAVLICMACVLWMAARGRNSLTTQTYSQFLDQVQSGQVASVIVSGRNSGAVEATCRLKDGKTVRTVLPADYRDALAAMQNNLVNIEIRDFSVDAFSLLMKATPFLLVLGIWICLVI